MNAETLITTVPKKDDGMAKRNIIPCYQATFPSSNCFKRIKEGSAYERENGEQWSSLITINMDTNSYLDSHDEEEFSILRKRCYGHK